MHFALCSPACLRLFLNVISVYKLALFSCFQHSSLILHCLHPRTTPLPFPVNCVLAHSVPNCPSTQPTSFAKHTQGNKGEENAKAIEQTVLREKEKSRERDTVNKQEDQGNEGERERDPAKERKSRRKAKRSVAATTNESEGACVCLLCRERVTEPCSLACGHKTCALCFENLSEASKASGLQVRAPFRLLCPFFFSCFVIYGFAFAVLCRFLLRICVVFSRLFFSIGSVCTLFFFFGLCPCLSFIRVVSVLLHVFSILSVSVVFLPSYVLSSRVCGLLSRS